VTNLGLSCDKISLVPATACGSDVLWLFKEILGTQTHAGTPLNAHPIQSAGIVVYEFFPMRETGLARNLSGKTR
jgi:hypothetical protein